MTVSLGVMTASKEVGLHYGDDDEIVLLPDSGVLQLNICHLRRRAHRNFFHLDIPALVGEGQIQK
jgi:hypothetical protein